MDTVEQSICWNWYVPLPCFVELSQHRNGKREEPSAKEAVARMDKTWRDNLPTGEWTARKDEYSENKELKKQKTLKIHTGKSP